MAKYTFVSGSNVPLHGFEQPGPIMSGYEILPRGTMIVARPGFSGIPRDYREYFTPVSTAGVPVISEVKEQLDIIRAFLIENSGELAAIPMRRLVPVCVWLEEHMEAGRLNQLLSNLFEAWHIEPLVQFPPAYGSFWSRMFGVTKKEKTAEELRKEACEKGYMQGLEEGRLKGHTKGYEKGFQKGYETASAKKEKKGFHEGAARIGQTGPGDRPTRRNFLYGPEHKPHPQKPPEPPASVQLAPDILNRNITRVMLEPDADQGRALLHELALLPQSPSEKA